MITAVERVSRWFGYLAMGILFLMAVHVSVAVAFRWVTARDIPLTLEVTTAYYMVALTFLPLALIDLKQGHIRAEFFSALLPRKVQIGFNILIRLTLVLFCLLLTWRSIIGASDATRRVHTLITVVGDFPTWPARWLVPLGLAFATLAGLLLLALAFKGRDDEVVGPQDDVMAPD
jgi:TRAP-type C4-dicarboxylate transport system permease small subunit